MGLFQERDKSRYRFYSDAIIAAVNGYFDRERELADDPYLETQEKEDSFLQRVLEMVRQGVQANQTAVIQARPSQRGSRTSIR